MNNIYLTTKNKLTRMAGLLTVLVLFNSVSAYAQITVIPELVFKNPDTIGTPGQVGTKYRYSNVGTGIDAEVKITAKSHNNVVLSDIDITSTGYGNAFQPLINYTGGGNYNNNTVTDWYMEFEITFFEAGTSDSVDVTAFNATALDIDGTGSNNTYLHEVYSFFGAGTYTTENNTTLSVSNVSSGGVSGKRFEAGNDEYTGIDVNASKARVTIKYTNTRKFKVRIGGKAKGGISIGSNGRQYSVWFKGFTYDVPVEAPLPVKLVSFTASVDKKDVVLNWITSEEKNTSHFTIQRSTDGREFTDAGMLFTDGDSQSDKSYSFTDKGAAQNSGVIYYRLKTVDIDTKYEYSSVRMVRIGKEQDQAALTVYPNPAVNEVRVTIPNNWQNKQVTYSLFNSNGNEIKRKVASRAGQTEIMNIIDLPAGFYMIKVGTGSETIVKQFVKQR